jgi:hypothetical protein
VFCVLISILAFVLFSYLLSTCHSLFSFFPTSASFYIYFLGFMFFLYSCIPHLLFSALGPFSFLCIHSNNRAFLLNFNSLLFVMSPCYKKSCYIFVYVWSFHPFLNFFVDPPTCFIHFLQDLCSYMIFPVSEISSTIFCFQSHVVHIQIYGSLILWIYELLSWKV